MTMHVCIFTTAHPWDDVRVKSKFAESFVQAGARVTWVGPDTAFFAKQNERDPRIDYRLVASEPGWSGRLQRFQTLRQTLQSVSDLDWIYVPDPDAAALALSARTGARVVFDIHEEYHKGHFVTKLPQPTVRPTRFAVQSVIAGITQGCHLVTSVNEAILDAYHAPKSRRLVTFNTPPEWFQRRETTATTSPNRVSFFHGKSLAGNGTPVLLEALAELKSTGDNAAVVMLPAPGADSAPYDPEFERRVSEAGVADMLDLRAPVAHRGMPDLMGRSQVGLISYDRILGVGSLPNRFFEYMALGMPVLVPQYAVQMRRIVEEERIGWVTDFEDPRRIAQAMREISDLAGKLPEIGARAKRVFQAKYAWEPIFNRFYDRLGEKRW